MKRILLPFVIASVSLAGCPKEPGRVETVLREQAKAVMAHQAAAPAGEGGYDVKLRLDVASVEAPIGTISNSEELWSYLDEESVHPLGNAGLGRNGIRAGLGDAETWPDLAEILQDLTGRPFTKEIKVAELGKALPLLLKTDQPMNTIFLSFNDNSLSGSDYPPGNYVLAISFSINPDDRSQVMITAVPQAHSAQRKVTYIKSPAGYNAVEKPTIFSFFPLAFQLRMQRKDFLLIGPNAEARRQNSPGNKLFISNRDGVEYETIYILIPELLYQPSR